MEAKLTGLQISNFVLIIILLLIVLFLGGIVIWQHFYYLQRLDEVGGRLVRLEQTQDSQEVRLDGFTEQMSSLFGAVSQTQEQVSSGFNRFDRNAGEQMQKMELILDRQGSVSSQLADVSRRIKTMEKVTGNLSASLQQFQGQQKRRQVSDKQWDSKRVRIEVDNPEGDSGWKDEYEFWLKPRFDLHENYGLSGWKPFAVEASEEKPEGFPDLPEFKHDMQRFLTFELGNTKENIFYGVADFDKPEEEYFPFDLYVDTDRDGELEEIGELEERGGRGRPDTFRIWVPYKDDDSDQYAIYLWSYLKKGPGDPGFSYVVKSARYAIFEANKKVIQVLLMDNTGNGIFNDESDRIVLDWDLDGMIECEDKNGMRPLYEPFGIGGEVYRVTECDPRGRRMVLRKQGAQSFSAEGRADGERSKGLSPLGRAKDTKTFFTGKVDRFSTGDNHLLVSYTEPVSPAKLDPGEKLNIKIQYQLGNAERVQIFARPYIYGVKTSGYRAHPSPVYKKAEKEVGEAEGWFYFDKPTLVNTIRVEMVDTKTGEAVCITSCPVNFQWGEYDDTMTTIKAVNTDTGEIQQGQPFPELRFESLSGETVDIGELKGKVVLLDFWAVWCGPCVHEMPQLISLYREYHDDGFEIIGISLDQNRDKLESYLRDNQITWPQYFDGKGWDNDISRRFGVRSIPTTVLLDKAGVVQFLNLRGSELLNAVAGLLGQQDYSPLDPSTLSHQTLGSTESVSDNPFYERIHTVVWDGLRYDLTFAGEQSIFEKKLGPIDKWVDGLAFHPDGRIAFSHGGGTTTGMMLAYWTASGIGESVVDLQYDRQSESKRGDELEKKGYFWFFSGPLAFGLDGTCYFSLGPCSPNGLYKVLSNSPVQIEKLYALGSTRALQIPLFDTHHLYSTSWNGIFRYTIAPNGKKPDEPWFAIIGDKIILLDCLIVSSSQVIADVLFRMPESSSDKDYFVKSLIFNRNKKSFRVLPCEHMGAMAISWDGQKMIHFDKSERTINEFYLEDQ